MKNIDTGQKVVDVKVRIPIDVHDRIVVRAIRNDRSMNKEIVAILRRQK